MRRSKRVWVYLWSAILLVTLAAEYRPAVARIAAIDRALATAAAGGSIAALAGDFQERFRECDYTWLVICRPKPVATETGLASALAITSPPNVYAQAVGAIPHLPDATWYVLSKRWHEGPLAFLGILVFIGVTIVLFIAFLNIADGPKPLAAIFALAAAPALASLAMFLLQYAFVFAMHGVLLLLQALLVAGTIPLAVQSLLHWYVNAREASEAAHSVVEITKAD
ncbi:MAG: hypothetical protein ACYDEK_04840 [Vulcanimicrobiaceae bacterium]